MVPFQEVNRKSHITPFRKTCQEQDIHTGVDNFGIHLTAAKQMIIPCKTGLFTTQLYKYDTAGPFIKNTFEHRMFVQNRQNFFF